MLHILNGDSLAFQFPTDIHGEKAITRECLVDGPVEAHSLEELWVVRDQFLSSYYDNDPERNYFKTVVPEFEKILTVAKDTKIYCWFELDLFCQVNFWFVMHLLEKHKGEVYLVLPEKADLRLGFAELNERQLEEHYRNAKLLTKNEREVIGNLWKMFQAHHIDEAMTLSKQVSHELPFLLPAVQAWKDSIPHGEYPGKPKATIIEIIKDLGTDEFPKVFREFKNRIPIYGFGDLQVKRLLDEIKKEAS
jgi:hypothetical protein